MKVFAEKCPNFRGKKIYCENNRRTLLRPLYLHATHWAVSPDSYYPSAFGFTQIHKYRLCASEIFPFIQRLQKKLYSENSPVKY